MRFESALNLVWCVLGVLALAGTIRARVRLAKAGARKRNTAPAWLHVGGVALIIAALFPYISATDDVLRIQYLNSEHGRQQSPVKPGSDNNLMRLYEAMDSPVICPAPQITFTLFFIALIAPIVVVLRASYPPRQSGRSPPALIAA